MSARGPWVQSISTALLKLKYDTALRYQDHYRGTDTDDPFARDMRAANDLEVEALRAELARRERLSGEGVTDER